MKGYGSEDELQKAISKWELNKFDVPIPKFLALL